MFPPGGILLRPRGSRIFSGNRHFGGLSTFVFLMFYMSKGILIFVTLNWC